MKDFFISYNKADKAHALAIQCWLEDAGFTTVMQAMDFHAGSNFVLEIHKAIKEAKRTLPILSPDYLTSRFTPAEWAAAFADDPTGDGRQLVPIRVRECQPDGLLKAVVYIDLVGLDMAKAQIKLLLELEGKSASVVTGKPAKKRASRRAKDVNSPPSISQEATGKHIYQSGGDMHINQKPPVNKITFAREPHHVSEAQAAKLKKALDDLGERDEKAGRGATYGAWMNAFKAKYELTTYKALPASDFDRAVIWIKQQKAINRPSLRRTNNPEWRKDHNAAIWACSKKLGWAKDEVHLAAQKYFCLKTPVNSIKELGEQRLEKFAAYMKRESRKPR